MSLSQTVFCDSKLLTQISGLVFDGHDNLYACNFGSETASIIKIDPYGNATLLTEQYGSDRNFASMVYLDGFLYVTGFNNCVYKVDIHNGHLSVFATLPNNGTNGITFFDDNFYVVTGNGMQSGNVYKIERNGKFTIFISENNLAGTQYCGIANDSKGNFYITDEGTNSVVKYNKDGTLINLSFITGPFQSIIIKNKIIYLSNYGANQISQYDMGGKLMNDNFAVGALTFCGGGMAISKDARFYCSLENMNGPGSGNVTIQMKHN
jgi:hypothetical protein